MRATARRAAPYHARMVPDALLAGALAGYGVAIPVGPIAVLIIEAGARRGFRVAFAAGAGAATADGVYALLAALAGLALAPLLEPVALPLRVAAVAVLAAIGVRGLLSVARRDAREVDPAATPASALRTYGQLVGLTILNPLTVTYFAALMLGLGAVGSGAAEKAAFVAAAFGASLSWQTLLAVAGALLHRHASGRLRVATSVAGNLIVLGFAARIATELVGR